MHQSSDSDLMPLLQNEDTVITAGRDEQYSNGGHIPCSFTSFSLGWGIYFWHNNSGVGWGRDRGPVLLTQESHITEATLAMLLKPRVDTSQALGARVHLTALSCMWVCSLCLFLGSQKWLFRYELELAAGMWVSSSHMCAFPVCHEEFSFSQ